MRDAPTVGLGNAPTAQAAPPTVNVGSPNVSTNADVKVTVLLVGAAIAAVGGARIRSVERRCRG